MVLPIWKDCYVSLGTAESYEYRIQCNGEVIYTGKAFKRPGESEVIVRINDVCANYMLNVLPSLNAQSFSQVGIPLFGVQIYTGGAWVTIYTAEFINDWSYDYSYEAERDGLAFPINGVISRSQWLTFSSLKASSIKAEILLKDGSATFVTIPVAISADFNTDFNSDFAKSVRPQISGTAVFKLDSFDAKEVTIEGRRFKVVDDCNRFILYYCNAHGGWDSLLIEGNHAEVDELTRHMREVAYDNRNVQNRGRFNYANEVTKRLTLHTSWLLGDEASRMHHLLNATDVYLYDTHQDAMLPVVLKNSSTEYKTYKGNGGQLVNYAIEVEFANRRVRR